MRDSVQLVVGNARVSNFLSYSIEADLYTADHAFRLELAKPELSVMAGARCDLYVNGVRELTGIVEDPEPSYEKSGVRRMIQGRDLMGLLVDSCCTDFIQVQNMTCQALASRLLAKVPFIGAKDITYQETVRGNLKKHKGKSKGGGGFGVVSANDAAQTFTHIEPGQTIFEVLKTFAASRGMMFFGMPDGTFVFGRPLLGGAPQYFLKSSKKEPSANNVLSGARRDDISKRYSEIHVTGQQQGQDSFGQVNESGSGGPAVINTLAVVTDPSFPFYKPFVATDNNDARSPKLHGQMLMEKQKAGGFRLQYVVARHSQNGVNWAINSMCHVSDEILEEEGDFLIYERIFEMSKETGPITRLQLGYPGIVA